MRSESSETAIRRFFLTKSDITEDIEANQFYASLDKIAGFFFRPARHLLGGHEVKWINVDSAYPVEPKAALSSSKGIVKFLKTIGSIILFIPFTIIGACFEALPFAASKRIREYKISSAQASNLMKLEVIQEEIKKKQPKTEEELKPYVLKARRLGLDLYHIFIFEHLEPAYQEQGVDQDYIDSIPKEILHPHAKKRNIDIKELRQILKDTFNEPKSRTPLFVEAAQLSSCPVDEVTRRLLSSISD